MGSILVLNGSPRKDGNTDLLVSAFVRGAEQAHTVEVLRAADLAVHPCVGCNRCFETEDRFCVQQDAMTDVYEKLMRSEAFVVASPLYFYGISAQAKAVIDRIHTPHRAKFPLKKLAMILVGAGKLPDMFDGALMQYRLTLNFFHLEDAGTVLVRGAKNAGDVENTDGLRQAFLLGQSM